MLSGSPPRVWGKRGSGLRAVVASRFTPTRVGKTIDHLPFNDRIRFTPTRVGKTAGLRDWRFDFAVHPHACGENGHRQWAAGGSGRFTPTRVGKTIILKRKKPPATVHPHACGENDGVFAAILIEAGSPPRVWGKLRHGHQVRLVLRFTPTRVGKTWRQPVQLVRPAVHPHACGENFLNVRTGKTFCGSPPRVWGKLAF